MWGNLVRATELWSGEVQHEPIIINLSCVYSMASQVESCVLEEQIEEGGRWQEEAYQYQPDLPHCSGQEGENECGILANCWIEQDPFRETKIRTFPFRRDVKFGNLCSPLMWGGDYNPALSKDKYYHRLTVHHGFHLPLGQSMLLHIWLWCSCMWRKHFSCYTENPIAHLIIYLSRIPDFITNVVYLRWNCETCQVASATERKFISTLFVLDITSDCW